VSQLVAPKQQADVMKTAENFVNRRKLERSFLEKVDRGNVPADSARQDEALVAAAELMGVPKQVANGLPLLTPAEKGRATCPPRDDAVKKPETLADFAVRFLGSLSYSVPLDTVLMHWANEQLETDPRLVKSGGRWALVKEEAA
jgi:hypothetical protein